MTRQQIDEVLTTASEDAFEAVIGWAHQDPSTEHNLYVYPSGHWTIEHPQYLQDHNTLAQASVSGGYEAVKDLVAALGETVADDAADEDKVQTLVEALGDGLIFIGNPEQFVDFLEGKE